MVEANFTERVKSEDNMVEVVVTKLVKSEDDVVEIKFTERKRLSLQRG